MVRRATKTFGDAARSTLWDDRGVASLEVVLVLGLISIPLIMFLALAATSFIEWMRDQAPNIFDEAATFTF